jgi:chromosome segregation ATPase
MTQTHQRQPAATSTQAAAGQSAPQAIPPFIKKTEAIAGFIRDVGIITGVFIGIPFVVAVGLKLYDIQLKSVEAQQKAFEQQVKANEAQIKTLETQNSVLKETHEAQIKTLETQNSVLKETHEAQIKAFETQNSILKETQYDRALNILKAQRETFELERLDAEQKRTELIKQLAGASSDNNTLKVKLTEAENKINSAQEKVKDLDWLYTNALQAIGERPRLKMLEEDNKFLMEEVKRLKNAQQPN